MEILRWFANPPGKEQPALQHGFTPGEHVAEHTSPLRQQVFGSIPMFCWHSLPLRARLATARAGREKGEVAKRQGQPLLFPWWG